MKRSKKEETTPMQLSDKVGKSTDSADNDQQEVVEGLPDNLNTFIRQTYVMFTKSDDPSIISWIDDDKIAIKDEERFSNEVLPKYFRTRNIVSFVRNLNLYGFRKVPVLSRGKLEDVTTKDAPGKQVSVYENTYFKKGRLDLLQKITRDPVKGQSPIGLKNEVKMLREKVVLMEKILFEMERCFEGRVLKLEEFCFGNRKEPSQATLGVYEQYLMSVDLPHDADGFDFEESVHMDTDKA